MEHQDSEFFWDFMQLARNSGNLIGPHLMEEAIQENIQTLSNNEVCPAPTKIHQVQCGLYHILPLRFSAQGSGTAWPAITRDTVYAHLDANFPESRHVEHQAVSAGVLSHWPREGCILKQLGTPESTN